MIVCKMIVCKMLVSKRLWYNLQDVGLQEIMVLFARNIWYRDSLQDMGMDAVKKNMAHNSNYMACE